MVLVSLDMMFSEKFLYFFVRELSIILLGYFLICVYSFFCCSCMFICLFFVLDSEFFDGGYNFFFFGNFSIGFGILLMFNNCFLI